MVGEATITSDLQTRRLIVVTDDETNENIRNIIQTLDKPKPQVLINVVFVQVTHDKGVDLGAEAVFNGTIAIKNEPRGIATTKFGVAEALSDATQFGAFYRILSQDVNATLRALSSVSKTEILSRPSVLTRNNQQATIMVGQSVPIITNSRVSDQTNTTINTVQYQDIGIILRVTPFITQEGLVEMIVSPEISSLSATTVPISNTVSSPVIDKRSADTVVSPRATRPSSSAASSPPRPPTATARCRSSATSRSSATRSSASRRRMLRPNCSSSSRPTSSAPRTT